MPIVSQSRIERRLWNSGIFYAWLFQRKRPMEKGLFFCLSVVLAAMSSTSSDLEGMHPQVIALPRFPFFLIFPALIALFDLLERMEKVPALLSRYPLTGTGFPRTIGPDRKTLKDAAEKGLAYDATGECIRALWSHS